MIFNCIVGMLKNTKTGKYHPILFHESPLPGPPSEDKLIRHKSKMHHTGGFESRADAEASAKELAEHQSVIGRLAIDEDIPWDDDGVPAMSAFFKEIDGKLSVAM